MSETLTKKVVVCDRCGEELDSNEGTETDYGVLCDDCLDELYTQCSICGEYVLRDDAYDFEDTEMCESCYSNEVAVCEICNERFWRADMTYAGNILVCDMCLSEDFFRCDNCGEYCYNDDGYYDEYGDVYLCPNCWDNHRYNYKDWCDAIIDTKKLKPSDSFNVFGVEVEAIIQDDLDYENPALRHFTTEDDGSLSEGGMEYISVPLPNPRGYKIIHNFSKEYAKEKLTVDTTCGLHIHLYFAPELVTLENLKKVFAGYSKMESLFFSMMPRSRRKNHYCLPLNKHYVLSDILRSENIYDFASRYYDMEIYDASDIPKEKYNEKRYHWVNFNSIFYRNTIEIRLHNGTCNSKKIVYWIQIHQRFLKWLIKSDIQKVLDLTEKQFLYEIMNKKLRRYIFKRIATFSSPNTGFIQRLTNALDMRYFFNIMNMEVVGNV